MMQMLLTFGLADFPIKSTSGNTMQDELEHCSSCCHTLCG